MQGIANSFFTSLSEVQQKKYHKGVCLTPYCMKSAAPTKTFCHSCRKKKQIESNPLLYSYRVLRNNAKRRKKDFSLTFEEFKIFAEQNDYMNKRGTRAKSFQVDRIDEEKGYHAWNIQCITLRENIHKYRRHKKAMGIDFIDPDPVPF